MRKKEYIRPMVERIVLGRVPSLLATLSVTGSFDDYEFDYEEEI